MLPEIGFSVLPNGNVELIDPALLADIPCEDLILYDTLSNEGQDFVLCAIHAQYLHRSGGEGYPVISKDKAVQARYLRMRLDGQSHNMAEVLAVRKFPSFKTDSTFNAGRENGSQFESCPQRGDWYKARATEAGVSTTGRFYSAALARFPGDPRAWISDRSDVLRVAKENGMTVSGDVNYTPPELPPEADLDIAADILERGVADFMAANPDSRRGDAEETVRSVLTGQVDLSNPLPSE